MLEQCNVRAVFGQCNVRAVFGQCKKVNLLNCMLY